MLAILLVLAADPTAEEIMGKLAENQKKSVELRRGVVYRQEILARMHRGKSKLAREHDYTFQVLPKPESFEREMVRFQGKYEKGGKYFTYDDPEHEYKKIDIDGNILHELVKDWTGEEKSKDGINDDLFPFTTEKQKRYDFTLHGIEDYGSRQVYKITFQPRQPPKGESDWDNWWAGEVLVDAQEIQPVLVTSHQAKNFPMAVKIMLGTDIRKTGFKITYKDFGEGLWFPEKYGGELEFRVLFGYARKVSISMLNADLKRANVESSVKFEEPVPH